MKRTTFLEVRSESRPVIPDVSAGSLWIRFFFLVISSTFCLSFNLRAQDKDLTFEKISIEQGLSQSTVRCVLQDSNGFMWFGTEDGLNKYDGYRFTVYQLDPNDVNSISGNVIRDIHEDQSGVLWIATNGGGLNKFDRAERFIRYQNDPHDLTSISSDYVWSIYEEPSGVLWIGTDGGGLNKLILPAPNDIDGGHAKFIHYNHDPANAHSLSDDRILSIAGDRSGSLWIGTRNGGLNRFDPSTGHVTRYTHDPKNPNSLSHNTVRSIYQDATGALWIGTDGGGLNKLVFTDDGSPNFTRYRHNSHDPNSLSDDRVWAIHNATQGFFWVGTNGGGLNYFDVKKGRFGHYRHDPYDPNSLSIDYVYSIYEDRAGTVWIGTDVGGICKLNEYKYKFALCQNDPHRSNSLADNNTWSFYEQEPGILWIGTRAGGLNKFDRKTGQFSHYLNNPDNPNSLPHDHVRCIYRDRKGVFWLGTDGGGLSKFLLGDKDGSPPTFVNYQFDPNNPLSLAGNRVYSILEDNSGSFWVGTRTGGLNRLVPDGADNPKTATFIHYQHEPNNPHSLSDNFVYKIYEDRSGVLWIGTFTGGLNKLVPSESERPALTFTHYTHDLNDPNSLSNNCILTIYEDRSGSLWIGTGGGGINKLIQDVNNGLNASFIRYTEDDGLANDFVYGILEDDQGNLWISTNMGLSKFNPKTETFKNYEERDGLQSNEFNGGAYYKSRSGEMFFGGINGFNSFYPEKIKDNPHIPPVAITGLFRLNQEVRLDKPISEIRELSLSYKDYVFSFEFAALDFTAPTKNKYAYKMEGLDEEWIYTDSKKRFATYTTLAPGSYLFRVKGSNNDGIWNEEGTSIKIIITPPVWKTWWFRTLSALFLIGLAFVGYRRRVKTVRMKTELQAAHDAQMSIMPQTDPQVKGFDISGVCIPANEVGGDFFDYLWLNEERTKFGIAVGDVSGKAMKSAMTAVMTDGMICLEADESKSIKEIMRQVNRTVYRKTSKQEFTALCLASLDILTKELTFTNAGLNEPLLTGHGSVISLKSKGSKLPLGSLKDTDYEETKTQLDSGAVLVFFTDGISEARNHAGEFYEEHRLKRRLEEMDNLDLSAKAIKDKIIEDVKRFSGIAQQHDDMTVIVVKTI